MENILNTDQIQKNQIMCLNKNITIATVSLLLFFMQGFSQNIKKKSNTFYIQEYIFTDTNFYNDLCNILTSDNRFVYKNNKIEGDIFVLNYSDSLFTSLEWFEPQYQYNFSIRAEYLSVMNYTNITDKVVGICRILNKDCLIWVDTPEEIILKLFTATSKKHRFTYLKSRVSSAGGYISWNMMLYKNNKLRLKGIEFLE